MLLDVLRRPRDKSVSGRPHASKVRGGAKAPEFTGAPAVPRDARRERAALMAQLRHWSSAADQPPSLSSDRAPVADVADAATCREEIRHGSMAQHFSENCMAGLMVSQRCEMGGGHQWARPKNLSAGSGSSGSACATRHWSTGVPPSFESSELSAWLA
jgi:hypothetical protein